MDLIYIHYTDFPTDSAHGHQIIQTCNALEAIGHRVTLVCAGDADAFASSHELGLGCRTVNSPFRVSPSRPDRVIYYLTGLRVATESDVIYTRDVRFLKFLSLIRPLVRGLPPIVYEAHKAHHQVERMSREQERRYIEVADAVVTQSAGTCEDLEAIGVSVRAVIPNAAAREFVPTASKEELRSKLELHSEDAIFVYAGTFDDTKADLELVLEGLGTVRKSHDVRGVFIGGTDQQVRDLRHHATQHGLSEQHVSFIGRISHKNVFPYLKASDFGIVPLRQSTQEWRKYTSPLKLYEYLVSGLRVIAANVEAMEAERDRLEGVYTYEAESVDSFVDCCTMLLESEATEVGSLGYDYSDRAADITKVISAVVE